MGTKKFNNLVTGEGLVPSSDSNVKKLSNLAADYELTKNRGGIAGGLEYVGASLAAGVGGVFEGTYDLVAGSLAALAGNKAYAEHLFGTNVVGQWHKNIEDGFNPNKAMKFTGDVASGLGQSATMLIPYAGPVLFYAGAIGGGIGSAVEKTGELGFKEYAYGATVGVIEGLLETYLGSAGQALSKVTKGATKSLMTNLTSQIAKDWAASAVWKGVAKDLISNAAGEFFEEAISEAIDPVLQRGFRIDEDASTSMKEVLYAGLVGFGSGLLMGGASTAISTGTAYRAGKRSIDNGNAELVVRGAHTVIDALKIDENTKGIAPYLEGLKSSLESYELAADKKSDAAAIYLGEVQGYMLAVESTRAVLIEDAKLRAVDENAAKSFAEFMSYADKVGDVSKNYTAEDWYSDKNKIRTRYAAFKWAGAFLGDTVAMRESVAFDEEIRADREGRPAGNTTVGDIETAKWDGESGTYYIGNNAPAGSAPEGDYLRVIKLQDGTYSIGRGNSSEQVRGYRGLTQEQAQAEFERIKGAVATERANVQQRQNLEAQARASAESNLRRNGVRVEPRAVTDNNVGGTEQATDGMYASIPTEQTFENPYTAQQMNAARRAVKNFDMLTSDQKGRILRWIASVDGKGIDSDVVSGVANIIRIRGDLQVMLAETREGVGGFRKGAVAGRNLIVIPSGKGNDILFETIAHEIGHDVESVEGFDELKKAALEATKDEDIKKWEKLYEGYPDADTEVAMKALGLRLATPRFIERYANKSMLRHLIDSGKQLIAKLRADEAGKLEIKTAEKLMRMLDGALISDNVHALDKGVGKTKHLFVGVKADTADKMKLATAQDMIANGADPEQVRKDTGWFRGYDGEWRFEIDDFDSSLIENPNLTRHEDDGEVYFTGKLTDIFNHPELYKAYPQLKDINIVIQSTDVGVDAIYQPKSNYITLSRDHFKRYTKAYNDYLNGGRKTEIEQIEQTPEFLEYNKWYDDEVADNMDATEWLKGEFEARQKFFSSELGKRYHQLKYSKDGFAGEKFELGWGKEAKAVVLHELQHAVQNIEGFATGTNTRDPNYDRNAGEIEAFDAGRRADLTAEQRKNTRPDIDRTDVVFAKSSSPNYALKRDGKGNEYWEIDSGKDIFKGLNTPEEYRNAAYKYLISNRDNKVVVNDGNGRDIIFIRVSAEEFTQSKESKDLFSNDPEMFKQKMRIVPSLEDLLLHSNVNWHSPDHKNHKLFKNGGFENYRGKVRIDNVIFNSVVRVGVARFGDVFYDINLEVAEYLPHANNSSASDMNMATSNNSIPRSSEKSTPSSKKSYNLTPDAAEQAARDAAEVEAFLNAEEALSARAEQTGIEDEAMSKAERAVFEAEISRSEVNAKDGGSRWFAWADVQRSVNDMVKDYGIKGSSVQYIAFAVHRAFNGFNAVTNYKERRENMINGLVDYIIEVADAAEGSAGRWKDKRRAQLRAQLDEAYGALGKETRRQKAKERIENAEERARAAVNGTAIATLLDRVRMRRFRTKTSGKITPEAFKNLESLARSIRPKYQINLQNAEQFLIEFTEFAKTYAKEAMNYAQDPASEVYRQAYNDAKGSNPILNYIDKRMATLLIEFGERESGSEWTEGDYEVLKVALERLLAMDSRFDKQYNTDGTFGETSEVADGVMKSLHKKYGGKVSAVNVGGVRSIFQTLIYNSLEPEAAVRLMENVTGKHVLSRMINAIKFEAEYAKADERKWLKELEDFKKKNKKWWKEWNEGDVVFDYTLPTLDGKSKTLSVLLTKDEAASFYMTSKRHQARAALALGRVEIADAQGRKGEQYRSRLIDGLTEAQLDELKAMDPAGREGFVLKCENAMDVAMRDLYKKFSAEDKQYIALIEQFYATTSKKEKRDMDTRLFGSTNVFDGYYYPISRSSFNRDMDLSASYHDLDDVSTRGYTFNKSTIEGAKSRLTIRGATEVTSRHARQLAMYKHLTMPLQNLQRLYNYKLDATTAGTATVRDYVNKYVWKGFEKYLSDYYKDVQGMSRRTADDAASQLFRHLQSGYVKFQLGANLKSMIKQFGSAFNMLAVADFDVWYKGLNPEVVFSKGALADMLKYSDFAATRLDSNEVYYAAGAAGTVGKISDALMKHLEWGDTGANLIMWSMAQYAVQKRDGLAIGTEENKQLAGKELDKFIVSVQDTSGAATKSAYARSPQVLVQGFTLFTSAPTKMFSKLYVATSEYFELRRMKRDGKVGKDEQERIDKLEKNAKTAIGKAGAAIVGAALFESLINLAWSALRGKDDEEEEQKFISKLAIEVGSNIVGIVPMAGTAAESLISGYDVSNLYLDMYNDGLAALRNTYTITADLAAGKQVSQQTILKNLRSVAYFGGQMTGIPLRNINTVITMSLNTVSPAAAYEYDKLFYEPAYSADLAKAVASGNDKLADSIVNLSLKERTGAASSYAADEVVRLAMAGYTVMPRAIPSTADVDGEEVKLTRKQRESFRELYSAADSAVIAVIATEQYAEISDELRAKAVKVAYEIYHSRAKSEVLGSELSVMAALSYFDEYIDVATLVAESAYIYGIKSADGIKRSELIKSYISGYSPEAQAILLYAAGYRSEQVKELLSEAMASLDEDVQNRVKKTLDF